MPSRITLEDYVNTNFTRNALDIVAEEQSSLEDRISDICESFIGDIDSYANRVRLRTMIEAEMERSRQELYYGGSMSYQDLYDLSMRKTIDPSEWDTKILSFLKNKPSKKTDNTIETE